MLDVDVARHDRAAGVNQQRSRHIAHAQFTGEGTFVFARRINGIGERVALRAGTGFLLVGVHQHVDHREALAETPTQCAKFRDQTIVATVPRSRKDNEGTAAFEFFVRERLAAEGAFGESGKFCPFGRGEDGTKVGGDALQLRIVRLRFHQKVEQFAVGAGTQALCRGEDVEKYRQGGQTLGM